MGKVLYSDLGNSILELMDCQCEPSQEECTLEEMDAGIADCYCMLQHFLDMEKAYDEGTPQHEMAKEEVAFWSRMYKTAKINRRRFVAA